jgi:hypothetical protein
MTTRIVNCYIEFNTSRQPTGNIYINGSKYTGGSTTFTAINDNQIPNSPISDSPFCLVSFQATWDGTTLTVFKFDGSTVTMTPTLATGQPAP